MNRELSEYLKEVSRYGVVHSESYDAENMETMVFLYKGSHTVSFIVSDFLREPDVGEKVYHACKALVGGKCDEFIP